MEKDDNNVISACIEGIITNDIITKKVAEDSYLVSFNLKHKTVRDCLIFTVILKTTEISSIDLKKGERIFITNAELFIKKDKSTGIASVNIENILKLKDKMDNEENDTMSIYIEGIVTNTMASKKITSNRYFLSFNLRHNKRKKALLYTVVIEADGINNVDFHKGDEVFISNAKLFEKVDKTIGIIIRDIDNILVLKSKLDNGIIEIDEKFI